MSQRVRSEKPPASVTPAPKRSAILQRKCSCNGSGECEECKKETLQRRASGGTLVTEVPSIVHQVLRTPGTPLDSTTRGIMEPHFGHDFGKVRVHADAAAGESAKAVHAAAYTVGRDVVFAPGQFNHRLLAHELTHVVQQKDAAPTTELEIGEPGGPAEREADQSAEKVGLVSSPSKQMVQRATWGEEYDPKDKEREEKLKGGIGPIKSTTEIDPLGTEAAPEIAKGTLEEIYPFLKSDLDKKKVTPETVERYRGYLNQAFRTMKINTVEAQANFLAHASEESGQLRAFTESQGEAQHWEEEPSKVKLTTSALPKDKDVNPRGNWEFIGRGAVQVTHEGGYVKVIAELEKTAEQYKRAAEKGDKSAGALAAQAQEAADAIKADPKNAAKPQYAFIVSAALMKNMQGDRKASQNTPSKTWTGGDSPSGWVGGNEQAAGTPQADALVRKRDAYNKIVCVLYKQAIAAGKKVPPARLKMWCGS